MIDDRLNKLEVFHKHFLLLTNCLLLNIIYLTIVVNIKDNFQMERKPLKKYFRAFLIIKEMKKVFFNEKTYRWKYRAFLCFF
jgi:hypothetical protein